MLGHELGAQQGDWRSRRAEQIADPKMPPRRAAVTLSGLTLRAALDAVVPGVARYEPAPPDAAKRTGLAHVLSFTVIGGGGTGFLVR